MTNRRTALLLCAYAVLSFPTLAANRQLVTVHKDPDCGCCGSWVAHLELNGFDAKVIETKEAELLEVETWDSARSSCMPYR
jgi:hypothetical protein